MDPTAARHRGNTKYQTNGRTTPKREQYRTEGNDGGIYNDRNAGSTITTPSITPSNRH